MKEKPGPIISLLISETSMETARFNVTDQKDKSLLRLYIVYNKGTVEGFEIEKYFLEQKWSIEVLLHHPS